VNHSEVRARLSEYLERDLDPEARARVESHLDGCADCGGELRELRATVSLLRRLPEPGHPEGLGEAVIAQIARAGARPARVSVLLRRAAEPRFAAPLAAGIAGLILLFQAADPGLSTRPGTAPPGRMQVASARLRDVDAAPISFASGFWGREEPGLRGGSALAGVISGAAPTSAYADYPRWARLRNVDRLLRGAGHPYSESLASRFESQPNVVMADWQPR
jgi:hypothetical protein